MSYEHQVMAANYIATGRYAYPDDPVVPPSKEHVMNWFALVMQGLTLAPGLIAHFKQTAESGASKQAKVLDAVATSVSTLHVLAPEVLAHPQVVAALKKANDAIYYAGQVADAIGNHTDVPAVPASIAGR